MFLHDFAYFQQNWCDLQRRQHRKSLAARCKIGIDYTRLFCKKGLTSEEYDEFELDKQPNAFRQSFLGLHEQRHYLDYLNPKKFYILARNKYLTHQTLASRNILKASLFAYYEPGCQVENDEIAHSLSGILNILQKKKVERCVVKATEDSHGNKVFVVRQIDFQQNDAVFHLFNGQNVLLSDILEENPLIFEEIIQQTAQLAAFNPSSVNTVRFMTLLYPDGSVRIAATFIKIGRQGKCVDNAGTGGNIDACISVETGEMQHALQYDGIHNWHSVNEHPDSHTPINGTVIENWEEIKSQVIRYQQNLPYVKAAGWDIAITPQGAMVVEVNDFWDRTGQLFIGKGWRDEIRDCYLAWQKTGLKFPMGRYNNKLPTNKLNKIIARKTDTL